ncbi:MAG: IS110 family transposase [Acidobacteriota bacterium]|nr:IS110 family transposase [Acidobacteriota bacterium]
MSDLNKEKVEPEFAAHIGLDWADQKHFWAMRTADGKRQRGELVNTPEAIQVWAAELAQRCGGRPIAVALEQSRGAVIAMLSKYAHLVLFPIHPNTVANYRKAFCPSGAKSDPGDGHLILELLLTHPDKFRRWQPDTVETRGLQFLAEERRQLVNQHTSEVQRLIGWLKQTFPQILQWFDDPACAMVGALLRRWPTLRALQKASPKTLRKFFGQHNCRSEERIEERIEQIRQAVVATSDEALMQTGLLCIQNSVALLEIMRAGIATFDKQIAEIYRRHPDRAIMESFPGAGPALEPRLIAAVGTMRERFDSANSMACFAGIAPVKESSGKSLWVHWRWACPKFIRQTFHEWAGCSIRTCDWARGFYDRQRDKGKGHHAAVRALAFKWIRIFFRCWRDRVPYNEDLYLKALQKHAPKPELPPVEIGWKTCAGFATLSAFSS